MRKRPSINTSRRFEKHLSEGLQFLSFEYERELQCMLYSNLHFQYRLSCPTDGWFRQSSSRINWSNCLETLDEYSEASDAF